MKRRLKASAVVFLLLLVPWLGLQTIPIHVYEGFEASGLSWSRWSRGRLVPGAVAIEHEIVRAGRPDYPILALRLENAHLRVTRRDEGGSHALYEGSQDARGRWLDFRFVVKFDSISGSVDATLDGKTIVHYRGATVFQPAHGYPERGLVYFKTGLYRDALGELPWTIYVDEYRKDECPASGCS